jgi:hypothetical protein
MVLDPWRRPEDPPLFKVFTGAGSTGLKTCVLGNRPAWGPHAAYAFAYGPFDVRVKDARLVSVAQRRLRVLGVSDACTITVSNTVAVACPLRLELLRGEREHIQERRLAPGEAWTVTLASE